MRAKLVFSSTAYNVTKWIAQIGLPAFATLYFTLATIWHLPNTEEVVGTLAAVDTFLGVLLGISAKAYNQAFAFKPGDPVHGIINVATSESGTKTFSLELAGDPNELDTLSHVTFKVNPPEKES